MVSVSESLGQSSQIHAELSEALGQLSGQQEITFTRYLRQVLPLDGFVFWVRADLVGQGYGGQAYASFALAALYQPTTPLEQTVKGSLHFSVAVQQSEDETLAVNAVTLTSPTVIQAFDEVSPTSLLIAQIPGLSVRFAFSRQGNFYPQSGLWHYHGEALYPALASQLIDDPAQLNQLVPVVSNSLPAWLALAQMPLPVWQPPLARFPLFPSFAVPANLPPPYGAVHIDPGETQALQATPYLDGQSSHWQLARDSVRLTLYGLNNDQALDFMDWVNAFCLNQEVLGLMNIPVLRDEKRVQKELGILAQKKTALFEVSYYQRRLQQFAQQFITACVPTLIVNPTPARVTFLTGV